MAFDKTKKGSNNMTGGLQVEKELEVHGPVTDTNGNPVGAGSFVVDASIFRSSTTGVEVGTLQSGQKISAVKWFAASNNSSSGGTLNVGVEGALDKFVDAQAISGTSFRNVQTTVQAARGVYSNSTNDSVGGVKILVSQSAATSTRRGELVIEFIG